MAHRRKGNVLLKVREGRQGAHPSVSSGGTPVTLHVYCKGHAGGEVPKRKKFKQHRVWKWKEREAR